MDTRVFKPVGQGIGLLVETRQDPKRSLAPAVPRRFDHIHNVGKLPIELAWFGFYIGPGVNPDVEDIRYFRYWLLHRGIDEAHARIPQMRIDGFGMNNDVVAESRGADAED